MGRPVLQQAWYAFVPHMIYCEFQPACKNLTDVTCNLQGMILMWDVDSGLAQLDKYFHSNDNHVISGALLGVGIVNCGIRNDCDPVNSFNFCAGVT